MSVTSASSKHIIDVISDNSLAYRYSVFEAIALADVLGNKALLAYVVTDRHTAPADATNYQALQQCWTFARRQHPQPCV